jgi:hypothetical protein
LVAVAVIVKLAPLAFVCVVVGVPETVSVDGEITRSTPVAEDLELGDVWKVVCT